jgi:three-Cys-motif partner protein
LIALQTEPAFTDYVFIESNGWYYHQLLENIASHQHRLDIQSFFDDCNKLLPDMLARIPPNSPLVVFFDPEGIHELLWVTVEEVAKRSNAHLIVTFSCMGVSRCSQKPQDEEALDRFYGTRGWRDIACKRKLGKLSPGEARAAFLDLYKMRLRKHFKYVDDVLFAETEGHKPLYYIIVATRDESVFKMGRQYKMQHGGRRD